MGKKLLKWLRLVIFALVRAVNAENMKYLSLSATMTDSHYFCEKFYIKAAQQTHKSLFLVLLISNLSECEETGGAELALLVYPLQGKQSKPMWSF